MSRTFTLMTNQLEIEAENQIGMVMYHVWCIGMYGSLLRVGEYNLGGKLYLTVKTKISALSEYLHEQGNKDCSATHNLDKTEFLLSGKERQWSKYLSMFPIELFRVKTNPAIYTMEI